MTNTESFYAAWPSNGCLRNGRSAMGPDFVDAEALRRAQPFDVKKLDVECSWRLLEWPGWCSPPG